MVCVWYGRGDDGGCQSGEGGDEGEFHFEKLIEVLYLEDWKLLCCLMMLG